VYLSTNRLRGGLAFVVVLILVLGLSPSVGSAARRPTSPSVTCEACLVVDLSTGDVIFGRATHRQLANASTTKMMTALVAVSRSDLREPVTVSPAAAAVGGGGLDLEAGDLFSVRDLLYALLLDSSNEAAAALADHWASGSAGFVRAMNRTARSLGATDTAFANPHGLDQAGHYSSAADLALIGREVLSTPALAAIVATPRQSISLRGGAVTIENRNLLLESYRGAIGVKTGRTLGAGEVLVAAAERGPHSVLAVAMRSIDAAEDAAALLDLGFAELRLRAKQAREEQERLATQPGLLLSAREQVGALVFDPSGATGVVAGADVEGVTPPEGVEIKFTPADRLLLPLEQGEEVGTVEVKSGGAVLGTVPALADDHVGGDGSSWGTRALSGLLRTAAMVMAGARA
jgi:D-alanyl-D-alanine carboxypeptidase (penicillin-binding protein 5/6)